MFGFGISVSYHGSVDIAWGVGWPMDTIGIVSQ